MEGYIVSREFPDVKRAKENSLAVYWSHQQRWVMFRIPKSFDKQKKLKELVRGKPLELYMRATIDGLNVEFPLVTTQWEMAVENAWIDNTKQMFPFRILSKPDDPSGLNLAIIESKTKAKFEAGDRVVFKKNWGTQASNHEEFELTLIREGSDARIVIVGEDNMSYGVETAIGRFSWVRENYLRMNKIHRFVKFFVI